MEIIVAGARVTRKRGLVAVFYWLVVAGFLAWLVLPHPGRKGRIAQVKAAQQQIANFQTALGMYQIEMGDYPTTEQGLRALIENPGDDKWNGPYMPKMPKDPWGNTYQYSRDSHHGVVYDLWTSGPDRQDGNEDDVGNWEKEKDTRS